eukprot:CAMPEP_0119041060 /NCGR_PEP_ID=MMETSP1177-20130426/11178_1 /TAXON_ID=2985 /ORGANISM="Ochromonas sp, Strain CCMP1899" /LENGTH=163 /DNA_ID=CAMNT_0007006729 /DNA_START=138 /DNA_END=629 /DNA_ORIENTATION=-
MTLCKTFVFLFILSIVDYIIANDDDVRIRIISSKDGKTICQTESQDHMDSRNFSCSFTENESFLMHGNNPIEMETYSLKTNKTISNEKLDDIRYVDDSIHSGHYHKFYIDDAKQSYVQKVLVMSGATYLLKSALNKIMDGYIWQFLGLPVFTIIIPGYYHLYQ